jgi:hypothetical protein
MAGFDTPYYLDRWDLPEGPAEDPVFYWEPCPDVATGTPYADGSSLPTSGPAGLDPFLACTVPLKYFYNVGDGTWYTEAGVTGPVFRRFQHNSSIPGGSDYKYGTFVFGADQTFYSMRTRYGALFQGAGSAGAYELKALNEQFGGRYTGFSLLSYNTEDEDGNKIAAYTQTEDPYTDLGSDERSIRYLMESKISELVDQVVESSLGRVTTFNIIDGPAFTAADKSNIGNATAIDAELTLTTATSDEGGT